MPILWVTVSRRIEPAQDAGDNTRPFLLLPEGNLLAVSAAGTNNTAFPHHAVLLFRPQAGGDNMLLDEGYLNGAVRNQRQVGWYGRLPTQINDELHLRLDNTNRTAWTITLTALLEVP